MIQISKKTNWNLENLVRDNVRNMQPYSSARDEFIANTRPMVYLDANENPFANGINRYSDPQQKELKEVLGALKNVLTKNILIGNGSDEVLDLIFRAFCEPKIDNVITLPPTYGMYSVLAAINSVENREVLLEKDFQPNVSSILSSVNINTKIIFLCSPNNPSGNSFLEESVLEILENFNGLVVIDEAYIDFSEDAGWLHSLEEFPNLVITQTLSKAYGAAGIRMGICYASAEIIMVLNKIKPPYNSNLLSQERAIQVLKNNEKIKSQIALIKQERTSLYKALLQINFVSKVYASDANFLLIKVDNADLRYKQLLDKGFVVRNRSSQPLCENTLRITIGTSEENKSLIKALQQL
tara:strand:- start:65401 stop:66462 length:1062 start_codon:yes stop_codon:yes gene_type:complete